MIFAPRCISIEDAILRRYTKTLRQIMDKSFCFYLL